MAAIVTATASRQLRTLQKLVEQHLSCFDVELNLVAEESLALDVSHGEVLTVRQIREGPVSRWNETALSSGGRLAKTVQAGDTIVAVNGLETVEGLLSAMRSDCRQSHSMVLRVRSHLGCGIDLNDFTWTDYTAFEGDAHLQEAFRHLVQYQKQRRGSMAHARSESVDPRTRFVELLKLWLRKSQTSPPALARVALYCQLCGDVRELRSLFPQQNKLSFIMVLDKVQEQLRIYLSLRGCSVPQLMPQKLEEPADSSVVEDTTASEGDSVCESSCASVSASVVALRQIVIDTE